MCCSFALNHLPAIDLMPSSPSDAYLSFRASPPLSCYRLNVLFGTAILVPDDREHFALLSVRLDPPRDDLQTGSVRRTPTFDESSIDANDHLLGRFIRFSILGNFPLNLFVDALPNRVDPASGGGMGSSAHRWEEVSCNRFAICFDSCRLTPRFSAVVLPASRSIVPSVIVDCLPPSPTHSTMIFQRIL